MSEKATNAPETYKDFLSKFPKLGAAHQQIAAELDSAGPLDARAQELVKLGVCIGAGLESAAKSHVRRSLDAGMSVEEIEHAVVLGMNSVGFPRTVAAWKWAQEVIAKRG